jgi:hypothetical protein
MANAVKPKITNYTAEEVLFRVPEREEHSEILDIGEPDAWCPPNPRPSPFLYHHA